MKDYKDIRGNGKKEIKTPAFMCGSCKNCKDSRCSFFDRHVIPNFNRCFYHTFYSPVATKFIPPKNLLEIMAREELHVA